MYEGVETLVDQANKPCALCKRPNGGIQVSCDYCEAYVCESCHWCHKNQSKHNVRICDGCDTFACRACDDMDICEECGQVLCEDCSAMSECSVCHKTFCNDSDCSDSCNKGEDCDSVLCHNCGWICKFCSTVLCEDCSNSCGKCGSVVCKQHAKYLAECETCGLPYCLVCLAQREPCVRCTQVSSKRMEQLVHLRLKSMYKAFKSGDVDNIIATVGSKDGDNQNSCGIGNSSASAADEAAARLLEELAAEEEKKDSAEKKKVAKKKKKKSRGGRGAREGAEDKETAPDPASSALPSVSNAPAASKKGGGSSGAPAATRPPAEAKASGGTQAAASKEEMGRAPAPRKKQHPQTPSAPRPPVSSALKLKSSELSDYCKAVLGGLSTTGSEVCSQFRGHLDDDVLDLLVSAHSHDLARLVEACAEMAGLALPPAGSSGGNVVGTPGTGSGRGSRKGKGRSRRDSDFSADPEAMKEDSTPAANNVSFMDDPLEARLKDAVANRSLTQIQAVLDDARGVPGLAALRKSAKKQMKKIAEVLKTEEGPSVSHHRHKHEETSGLATLSYSGGTTSGKASLSSGASQSNLSSALSGSATASQQQRQPYHQREPGMVIDLAPGIVGWVIGRGGVRIKDIQQRSGCKMWVDQDVADEEPRKLYINGTRDQIDSAAGLVKNLIDTAPVTVNNAGAQEDVSSQIIDCPPHLVGLLIGRKGWTIKNIQMQSGAQVSINQSVREGAPRKIIVSGTSAAVEAAAEMVRDVLAYPNAIDPEKPVTDDGVSENGSSTYDFNTTDYDVATASQDSSNQITTEKPKVNDSSNNTFNDTSNSNAENPWLQQAKAAADAWAPAPQQPAAAAWQKSGGWASNPVISQAKQGKSSVNQPQQQQAAGIANSLTGRPQPPPPPPEAVQPAPTSSNLLTPPPYPGAESANALNQDVAPLASLQAAPTPVGLLSGSPPGQQPPPPPAPHPSHAQALSGQSMPVVHRARSDANLDPSRFLLGGAAPQGQASGPGSVGMMGSSVFGGGFAHPPQREAGISSSHKSLSTPALGQFAQLGELLDPSPSWQPLGHRSSTKSSWQPFGSGFGGGQNETASPAEGKPEALGSNLGLTSGINQLGGFPLWDPDNSASNFQPPGPSLLPGQGQQDNTLIPDSQEAQVGSLGATNAFSSFSMNNFFNSHGMDAAEMSRMLYGTETEGPQSSSPSHQQQKPSRSHKVDTQLENFLSQLSLGKYHDIFRDNEIDMHALTLMTEADFAELNIPKGPRLKIINNLQADSQQHMGASLPVNPSDNQCKICMEKQIDAILLNCGHMIACASCANSLCSSKRPCPVCSQEIERIQRIFVS